MEKHKYSLLEEIISYPIDLKGIKQVRIDKLRIDLKKHVDSLITVYQKLKIQKESILMKINPIELVLKLIEEYSLNLEDYDKEVLKGKEESHNKRALINQVKDYDEKKYLIKVMENERSEIILYHNKLRDGLLEKSKEFDYHELWKN